MDGMANPLNTRQPTALWWVMRGVWGLLAFVHLWPMAAVGWRFCADPSLDEGLVVASLVGVFAIFACKALDARWLRFHRPGIEFTAFVVAAALVHGDASSSSRLPALAAETATTVVVAAGVVAAASRRVRRRAAEFLRGLARSARSFACGPRLVGVIGLASWRRPERRERRGIPVRGPPSPVF